MFFYLLTYPPRWQVSYKVANKVDSSRVHTVNSNDYLVYHILFPGGSLLISAFDHSTKKKMQPRSWFLSDCCFRAKCPRTDYIYLLAHPKGIWNKAEFNVEVLPQYFPFWVHFKHQVMTLAFSRGRGFGWGDWPTVTSLCSYIPHRLKKTEKRLDEYNDI